MPSADADEDDDDAMQCHVNGSFVTTEPDKTPLPPSPRFLSPKQIIK